MSIVRNCATRRYAYSLPEVVGGAFLDALIHKSRSLSHLRRFPPRRGGVSYHRRADTFDTFAGKSSIDCNAPRPPSTNTSARRALFQAHPANARFKVRFPSLAPPRHTPRLGNFGGRHWRSKCITFYPTWTYRFGRETPFPFPSHDLLARRQMFLWHSRGRTRISPMSTQPSDGACWHNYLAASVCAFLNSQLQIDLRSGSSPPRELAASYLGGELAVVGAADRNCVATPAVMSDGRFPAA